MTTLEDEAVSKPGMAGAHTNQRLNLSKPREGPRKIGQGFKPDSGNPTVRHYRGASRNVSHGEIVTPSAIERAGTETPHLQRSALDLYPDNGQQKPGTARGSPRRSRTAKASRISRRAVKSRCAREWGGWGRLSFHSRLRTRIYETGLL